jgi:hypothetical protein
MSSIRNTQWGKLPSQVSDWKAYHIYGQSTAIDSSGSNVAGGGLTTPTGTFKIPMSQGADISKTFFRMKVNTLRRIISNNPQIAVANAWFWGTAFAASRVIEWWRAINLPNDATGNQNYRYRSISPAVTWKDDAYSPLPGVDIDKLSFTSKTYTAPTTPTAHNYFIPITDVLLRAIRGNAPFKIMGKVAATGGSNFEFYVEGAGKEVYADIWYWNAVEFFESDGAGNIDLSKLIDSTDQVYMGVVERGESSTPIEIFIRNFTSALIKTNEVFDDHPEWTVPYQNVGTGTGQLDYVDLDPAAVSQKYTIKFSSPTAFEVLAEADGNNPDSLHPSYDADPNWVGNTSGWSAPTGGFSIPSTAWQSGMLVNDEFIVYVSGNTTDASWPADSNQQVQITFNSGGVADAANWRPITGHRIKTAASVTIDATTKLIPTLKIDTSDWPIGNRAWIGDDSAIQHGDVKSVQTASIGSTSHTGTGNDDITLSGNYNGTINDTLRIRIESGGGDPASPNTFEVSFDGGSTYTLTGLNCTTSPQSIGYGIYVAFGSTTGHVSLDYWDAVLKSFAIELENLINNSDVFAAGTRIATSLPLRDISASVWRVISSDSGVSQGQQNRVYMTDTTGFLIGDTVFLFNLGGVYEEKTVQSISTDLYLDLTSNLTEDYTGELSICQKANAGQKSYFQRIVASAISTEEEKTVRMAARIS